MSGEFLQQFLRVIEKGQQDVLTPLDSQNEERPIIPCLSMEDGSNLVLDRSLSRLLAAS